MFVKVSNSGIIQAVLTFEKNGTDYNLVKIDYAREGVEYEKSIKQASSVWFL